MTFVTPVVEHWLESEIGKWVHHEGSIRRPITPRVAGFRHVKDEVKPEIKTDRQLISVDGYNMRFPVCAFCECFHMYTPTQKERGKFLLMVQWIVRSILHDGPIGKSSPCGSRFPSSLSEWSFTI